MRRDNATVLTGGAVIGRCFALIAGVVDVTSTVSIELILLCSVGLLTGDVRELTVLGSLSAAWQVFSIN